MIILDPGHGVNTAGKRSPVWSDGAQLYEWEFNRDVVRRIQNRLDSQNIPCTVLVKEAIDISLKVRCERANAIFKKDPHSFLISVHGNAGGGEGWEVWTSPGQTASDLIATFFYTQAKAMLQGFKTRNDYSDEDPDKECPFYILKHTTCPAVLTENLFYDNEKECRFMMSDFGRELIAKFHAFAIFSYLNLNNQ